MVRSLKTKALFVCFSLCLPVQVISQIFVEVDYQVKGQTTMYFLVQIHLSLSVTFISKHTELKHTHTHIHTIDQLNPTTISTK